MRRPLVLPLALVAATIAARPARAQGNDRSAPIGGRSALMGNTGVALAQDGSAPFLNPATIVRIDDQSLAFSVNFFSFGETVFSNWHQPGPVDASQFGNTDFHSTSIDTNGFNVLPSTLCLFFTVAGLTSEGEPSGALHKGRQKLAFCVGNLESNNLNLGALSFNAATPGGTTAQVQSFSSNWNRLYIGPTYSASLTDDFAVGLSLHAVATNDTFDIEGSSITSNTSGGSVQSSIGTSGSGHAVDVTALLGAIYRRGPFTIGASFQTPSVHFYGSYNGGLHSEYVEGTANSAVLMSGSGSFSAPPPVRASLGLGGTWRRLSLELDATYEFSLSDTAQTTLTQTSTTSGGTTVSTTAGTATYTIPARPMVNIAGGFEYFLFPQFSLVGGASSNLSTMDTLSPTMTPGNLIATRNNSVSASFGVGSYGLGGNLLLGFEFGYGWGEAIGVNSYVVPNDLAAVDTQTYSGTFILAGATNLRAITRAVEDVTSVVTTGKPGAKPLPIPLGTEDNGKPETKPAPPK